MRSEAEGAHRVSAGLSASASRHFPPSTMGWRKGRNLLLPGKISGLEQRGLKEERKDTRPLSWVGAMEDGQNWGSGGKGRIHVGWVGMPFPVTVGTREAGPAGNGMKPQERSEQARNLDVTGKWMMVFEAMDLE